MLELACRYGEGPIELREIAKKENISFKYLEQVINPLRAAGLVKSIRGSKGGYSLARPPSEIRLYDVVETLEGQLYLLDCLQDAKVCQKAPSCVMRDIWKEVSEAVSKIFYSMTLEEMVHRKRDKEGRNYPMYQI